MKKIKLKVITISVIIIISIISIYLVFIRKIEVDKTKPLSFISRISKVKLSPEDCPMFYIPDESTNFTTCKEIDTNEKNELCKKENKIFYNNKCEKVLTEKECEDKTSKNEFYHLVPNEDTQKTTCRVMNKKEREEFCVFKNMFWTGDNCLDFLKKPEITINEIGANEVIIKVNIPDFNINLISIKYFLNLENEISEEDKSEENEIIGEIILRNEENKFILFKIDNLQDNTNFSIKVKFLTNINGYESPLSDKLDFVTPCNKKKFTDILCRKDFGPKGSTNTIVEEKYRDPKVKTWPFFKKPDPDNCKCREMTFEEKKDYCIDNFYSLFKINNRNVEITNDNCLPEIIKLEAPLSKKLVTSLNINQNIDGPIEEIKDYRIDYPYRLLLNWSMPDLNITGRGEDAAPIKYNIYRMIDDKYELIHEYYPKNDEKDLKWVDGDNKNFPKTKFQNKLEPNKEYFYKITAVNKAGEGEPLIDNGITIPRLITNEECNTIFDDPDEKINFRGFHQVINYSNNSCSAMPSNQRQLVCESLDMIQDPYPNYYIEENEIRTCAPLVENLAVPGRPEMKYLEKTSNSIKIKIIPPNNKGIPILSHYYVIWENRDTGDKGRLEDIENKGLLGTKILESNNFIIEHNNLLPGSEYNYKIVAVSINDKIWRYKSTNMLDGKPVGMSDSFSISATTDFTIPLMVPNLKLKTQSLNNLSFIIGKFEKGKEGGSTKGQNLASIIKYKITKQLLLDDSIIQEQSVNPNKIEEFIFELRNINKFNQNHTSKIQVSFDSNKEEYTVIDYNIEPRTKYEYRIYAKNDKIDSWSNLNSAIILKTPTLSPDFTCNDVTNINHTINLSKNILNKKIVRLSWDKSIDPNIEKFSKFKNIYTHTQTKYTINVQNLTDNILFNSFNVVNDNIIFIDGLTPGKSYNFIIFIEHYGTLELSNGYKNFVKCSNNPKLGNTLGLKELTQEDCKNEIFSDTNSIQGENVFMDIYNLRKPFICTKKNNESLTKWCKENKDENHIYWSEKKQCVIPKDGEWKLELNNSNGPCTIDGFSGDTIKCGGGKRVIKQWRYIPPVYGGKDIPAPNNTTLNSGANIAYILENCNDEDCKTLCEKTYFGKFKSNSKILSNSEFNSNKFCDTDATIPSNLELEHTITQDCPKCGDPSIKKKVVDVCTDGLYGNPELIDCMKRKDIGDKNTWIYSKNVSIDDSTNNVKQYIRNRDILCDNLNWCDWRVGEWTDCNTFCGIGSRYRLVNCEVNNGCNSLEKPITQISCNEGSCKGKCLELHRKWNSNKESLTIAEFNLNQHCEKKDLIEPRYTVSDTKCDNCGDPSSKFKRTIICVDGLYGPDNKTKCKNVYSDIDWVPNGTTTVDGTTVDVFKSELYKSCNINWCEWKTDNWGECSTICGTGQEERNVYCPINGGCDPSKRPNSNKICLNESCQSLCLKKFKKWKGGKDNLTQQEFDSNNFCETKNLIIPSITQTTTSCKPCNNPNSTYTLTRVCRDGLYGPDDKIKCKKVHSNIIWTPHGNTDLDGTKVDVFINVSHPSCNNKWCNYSVSEWRNCNPRCGTSCNDVRDVVCAGPGACDPNSVPSNSRRRDGGSCWNPGRW
jgi:hypothetical protein